MPRIDPHSGTGRALAAYIDERLDAIREDLDALECDDRTGHQCRGRLDELQMLRAAMTDEPAAPQTDAYPLP